MKNVLTLKAVSVSFNLCMKQMHSKCWNEDDTSAICNLIAKSHINNSGSFRVFYSDCMNHTTLLQSIKNRLRAIESSIPQ